MAKVETEDIDIDMTPMIDVVFLLIIFFILMPPKTKEGHLQSYLPNEGTNPAPPSEPETVFNIIMRRAGVNDQGRLKVSVKFNDVLMGYFDTLSTETLDQIYADSYNKDDRKAIMGRERISDVEMYDPKVSQVLKKLLGAMGKAQKGSENGYDTDILLDSQPDVPFKVILAILDTCQGAGFTNLKFVQPPKDIFKQGSSAKTP